MENDRTFGGLLSHFCHIAGSVAKIYNNLNSCTHPKQSILNQSKSVQTSLLEWTKTATCIREAKSALFEAQKPHTGQFQVFMLPLLSKLHISVIVVTITVTATTAICKCFVFFGHGRFKRWA